MIVFLIRFSHHDRQCWSWKTEGSLDNWMKFKHFCRGPPCYCGLEVWLVVDSVCSGGWWLKGSPVQSSHPQSFVSCLQKSFTHLIKNIRVFLILCPFSICVSSIISPLKQIQHNDLIYASHYLYMSIWCRKGCHLTLSLFLPELLFAKTHTHMHTLSQRV